MLEVLLWLGFLFTCGPWGCRTGWEVEWKDNRAVNFILPRETHHGEIKTPNGLPVGFQKAL